jgi:transcriptional regulator with XRE-family HTH domain
MAAALALRNPLDSTDLGELITAARRAAGLSQTALAAAIGTAQSVISRWERGVETPRVETLVRILRACGYEPDLVLRSTANGKANGEPDAATAGQRLAEVLELAEHLPKKRAPRQLAFPPLR